MYILVLILKGEKADLERLAWVDVVQLHTLSASYTQRLADAQYNPCGWLTVA